MPGYGEIRLSITTQRTHQQEDRRARRRRHPHRDRGPARLRRAALLHQARLPFATSYHTQFPEYLRARAPVPLGGRYPILRRFHGAGQILPRADEKRCREARRHTASPTRVIWSRASIPRCSIRRGGRERTGLPVAAAGLPLCRPRRGRKEHRAVPQARSARHQARRRRRPEPQGAEARLPQRHLRRPQAGRGAGALLCQRRLLRLPQPHRHVWARPARGAGQRYAGRGLPVTGPIDVIGAHRSAC